MELEWLAKAVSDLHYGIGSDGLILTSDCQTVQTAILEIYNGTATESAMCGNGIWCVAIDVYMKMGIKKKNSVCRWRQTADRNSILPGKGVKVENVRVQMGISVGGTGGRAGTAGRNCAVCDDRDRNPPCSIVYGRKSAPSLYRRNSFYKQKLAGGIAGKAQRYTADTRETGYRPAASWTVSGEEPT
ncbi:MAG: hypothetical protein V8S96_02540 [Lachnospiraceae bacterium]